MSVSKWIRRGVGAATAVAGVATGNPALAISGASQVAGTFGGGEQAQASKSSGPQSIPAPTAVVSASPPSIFYPSSQPRAGIRAARKQRLLGGF